MQNVTSQPLDCPRISFLAQQKYLTLTVGMLVCVCVTHCNSVINQDEIAKITYDLI